MAGAIILESVFYLPGLGRLALGAISARDLPVVQGVVLFVASVIVAINVAAGDSVTRGQTLIVLEAMKIQHQLKAALDAKIESVTVQEGQQVSNRTILVTMAADAAAH